MMKPSKDKPDYSIIKFLVVFKNNNRKNCLSHCNDCMQQTPLSPYRGFAFHYGCHWCFLLAFEGLVECIYYVLVDEAFMRAKAS